MYLWPYSTIPTLLYTWQYYSMVERAVNSKSTRFGFWVQASFVAVVSLGITVTTFLEQYYLSLGLWYLEPGSGHFDAAKSASLKGATHTVFLFVGASVSLCCLGSAAFLCGTIYWVHKMTCNRNSTELQAGGLNL